MQTTTSSAAVDFSNGRALIKSLQYMRKKDCTFAEFVALRTTAIERQPEILQVITRMTIPQIEEMIYPRPGWKKAQYVEHLAEACISMFSIGKDNEGFHPWTSKDQWTKDLIARAQAVTEEDFNAWQQQRAADAAALQKALTNPETLEEFKTFINHNRTGEKALSSEQQARYDELMTGKIGEQKQYEAERKAQIVAVSVGETDLLIVESFHTKKQIPLWVVRLSDRVERPIFEELRDRAQDLGGYYSSYRGKGAIPGFTFERKEAAELFTQIKDGDVNASQLRAAINAEKTQARAERVQEKAEGIEDRATEQLEKDRKTNTARRARMASNIERQAIAEIEFAKALYEIGERTKNGSIKHLGKLATIVQLEDLYAILSACKWDYIKSRDIREESFSYTPEAIDLAKFPYPSLCQHESTYSKLEKLSGDDGKKLAAARMLKRLKSVKGDLAIKDGRAMEDFNRLYCWSSPSLDQDTGRYYRAQYMKYARIKKLGFTTIYELRAALRELYAIDEEATISPEFQRLQQIRELERKFITLNFPGFFPTPEDLAAALVRKAQIEPGNTICEPEAGLGHLAEAITEAHPENDLTCIENYPPLVDALRLKELNAICADFLTVTGQTFDRILMNPPFDEMADIDHVRHAWTLLNPGGRLVAVMAGNKSGERPKIKAFREFVEQYGSMESNEAGAFLSSFRPTGVNTVTVVLDKPLEASEPVKEPAPEEQPAAKHVAQKATQGAFNFGERAA